MPRPCTCGATHHEGANYYVSVVDGKRRALLAGPFASHADALDHVEPARVEAAKWDPWTHFYAFGTVAMPADYQAQGRLNAKLGLTPNKEG